jgi:hypothetical protein
MVKSNYSPTMLEDVLEKTSIPFLFTQEQLQQVDQWASGYQQAIVGRFLEDQVTGGEALTRLIKLKFTSSVDVSDAIGAFAKLEITNQANVPLTGFVVKRLYKDKDKKVLWSSTGILASDHPIVGGDYKGEITFYFDSWERLRKQGLSKDKIHWWSMEITSARNAVFLNNLKTAEGHAVPGEGYKFRFVNESPFVVKRFVVRCEYIDRGGKPILNKWGSWLTDTQSWTATLQPGQGTVELTVKEWTDFEHLWGVKGLPKDVRTVYPQLRVVDAVLERR